MGWRGFGKGGSGRGRSMMIRSVQSTASVSRAYCFVCVCLMCVCHYLRPCEFACANKLVYLYLIKGVMFSQVGIMYHMPCSVFFSFFFVFIHFSSCIIAAYQHHNLSAFVYHSTISMFINMHSVPTRFHLSCRHSA